MYLLESSVLITLVFSLAGLVAALAAGVVAAGNLASTWHHSEPTASGEKPKGSRCANAGRRLNRGRDCPAIGRRKHR